MKKKTLINDKSWFTIRRFMNYIQGTRNQIQFRKYYTTPRLGRFSMGVSRNSMYIQLCVGVTLERALTISLRRHSGNHPLFTSRSVHLNVHSNAKNIFLTAKATLKVGGSVLQI